MKTLHLVLRLLATSLSGLTLAAADSNPFDQAVTGDFAGRFTSANVQLRLKPDGDKLTGTLRFHGRDHTVRGVIKSSTFMGEGTDGAKPWSFTATVKGDELTFTADPDSEKPHVERLQRQRLTLPQGVWLSDKVEINFENKGGTPSGTLKTGGRDYTFTGVFVADEVEGKFTDGQGSHPFTVRARGQNIEFESGPFAATLESKTRLDAAAEARKKAEAEAAARRAAGEKAYGGSLAVPPVFTNSLDMLFVRVPGTKVLFSIWETRVKDYEAFARATGSAWEKPGFEQGPTHPAVNVSWDDAKMFCTWLTKTERRAGLIESGQTYRLPTDAEWSVAVGLRSESDGTPKDKDAEIKGVYPWGTQWPPPEGAGNFADMTAKMKYRDWTIIEGYDDDFAETAPVGSFKANQFGLFDLGGNVWEWCEDWYDGEQKYRVMRGASWRSLRPAYLLSSYRSLDAPDNRGRYCGFRVVLVGGSAP